MTPITTMCPRCGRVELDRDDITLVTNPPADAWYMFDCTGCVHRVARPATDAVVVALISVGVPLSIVPAEMWDEARTGAKGPLSTDDVLDARLWLGTHHDLAERAAELLIPQGASMIPKSRTCGGSPQAWAQPRQAAADTGQLLPRQRTGRDRRYP